MSASVWVIFLTGAVFSVGCQEPPPPAATEPTPHFAGGLVVADHGRFAYPQPPIRLLAALTRADTVTVDRAPTGWISKAVVESLMALRDSPVPYGSTVNAYSSSIPSEPSTLGREALFLIQGYRDGVFPPGLTSRACTLTSAEAERWWEDGAKVTPRRPAADLFLWQ